MAIPAKTRLAGALAGILALPFCAAGTSQAADNSVINGQLQLGDVFSGQTLNVESSSQGVSADSVAVGDIVSATGRNHLDFQSDQAVAARVEATTDATVTGDAGPYFATTASATGNSATAGTCCALTEGSSLQTVEGGGLVAARTVSRVGTTAGVSVDASAIGNTTGWEQSGGQVQTWTGQNHGGQTLASNTGQFTTSTGAVGLTATAVSNNVTVDNAGATTDIGAQQIMDGTSTDALIDVRLGSGTNIDGMATGVGNIVDSQNTSPDAAMNVSQTNAAPVNAATNLDVTSWSGDATAVAYGVGNSVILSNNGPSARLWSEQTSAGDVTSTATFTGGTGANVYASSTAMGNAVSGYACAECGGAIDASNTQTTSSRVRANSTITTTGRVRSVAAQASAIGNSATYEASSGN